jgi:hypothetical protein
MKYFRKFQLFVILIGVLSACSQKYDSPPSGKVVPWEDLDNLIVRSNSQMENRRDDLELRITLSKHQFESNEDIEVEATLLNKTDKNVIVRRIDAMPVFGKDATNIHGIMFIITSHDTETTLGRGGLLLNGFAQESLPPPESFSVLPAKDTSTHIFKLFDIFGDIPGGSYSIQINYTNDYFGAMDKTDSETYFIDYDAWIGTVLSNVETFQITP